MRVLLKHRFMTSVLAVKLNNWLIVFIGTGDGQLLKVRRPLSATLCYITSSVGTVGGGPNTLSRTLTSRVGILVSSKTTYVSSDHSTKGNECSKSACDYIYRMAQAQRSWEIELAMFL